MRSWVFTMVALLAMATHAAATPVGTAFTYQGQLNKSSTAYTGSADAIFRLYDASSGGAQVGSNITVTSFSVTGGLFTVDLDFGAVFTGTALWLDIQVRTPPDGSYTQLNPRVRLAGSPFAMYALNAPAGSSQWVNSTYGIEYQSANVGIGGAAQFGRKLNVYGGTSPLNPVYVVNDNASYASVYTANFATNGYGWYDDQSDRHYLSGNLGLGTLTPGAKVHAVGGTLGIWGQATGNNLVAGNQCGILGVGLRGSGPFGTFDATGVIGTADYGIGITGVTTNGISGMIGQNTASGTIGYVGGAVAAVQGNAINASGFGGYFANSASGGVALKAAGLAQVGTLQILGADLAESFPIEGDKAEPGTVLMLGGDDGAALRVADEPYSRRVAGVVSGANGLAAAVVLKGKSFEASGQAPVALSGRVWVKCDATHAPIHVGDLLTTADRKGHAMVASDRERAYGAVLGKAMTSLESGRGLVLVLVSLQ